MNPTTNILVVSITITNLFFQLAVADDVFNNVATSTSISTVCSLSFLTATTAVYKQRPRPPGALATLRGQTDRRRQHCPLKIIVSTTPSTTSPPIQRVHNQAARRGHLRLHSHILKESHSSASSRGCCGRPPNLLRTVEIG